MSDSLPGQYARTRRFTLGVPHEFRISPDGGRVAFLRSRRGDDPVTCLWTFDLSTRAERLVADPGTLMPQDDAERPPGERPRREPARQLAAGITEYATDRAVRRAAFAVSGRLWVADLGTGDAREGAGATDGGTEENARAVRELPTGTSAAAPRLDPAGDTVAYVAGGSLRIIGADGSGDRELATPGNPDVCYGLPEYIAAEWGRRRGYWWSPDGRQILVARADTARVQRWHITDPSEPGGEPAELAYPAAGTPNADVSLWIISLDGGKVAVDWDRAGFEYVVAADWGPREPVIVVQSRDQKTVRILAVDPRTGMTRGLREDTNPYWVTIVPGVPAFTGSGALAWAADSAQTRRLLVDGDAVTPPGLQVREVISVDGDTVLFAASTEPADIGLWTFSVTGGLRQAAEGPGVHQGHRAGGTTVIASESLDHDGVRVTVQRDGMPEMEITSSAEPPVLTPRVELSRAGGLELRTAVLFPSWHQPGTLRLPVLMDPYGGAGAQRVLAARRRYLVSQWFADQGFAVVVADGRGTPGRGPTWERAVYRDKGKLPLEDQITALHAAAGRYPDLDLDRVGIRGWSFGGYLAALAVLRRPDVFHAAVAGAPVSDQRLYNTHWNERFLGHPRDNPQAYERSSLLSCASSLRRPLMLIHGLADDNVVPAHTLLLSAALTAAGRPHTALLLPGMTHRPADPVVAEKLLVLEADFLAKSLHDTGASTEAGS